MLASAQGVWLGKAGQSVAPPLNRSVSEDFNLARIWIDLDFADFRRRGARATGVVRYC